MNKQIKKQNINHYGKIENFFFNKGNKIKKPEFFLPCSE